MSTLDFTQAIELGQQVGRALSSPRCGPLRAGAAQIELELPAGTSVGGYIQPATIATRPGSVVLTALSLETDAIRLALLGIDAATVTPFLFDLIRAIVPAEITLVTTASHSHTGPGGIGDRPAEELFFGPLDRALCQRLVSTWSEAMAQAWKTAAPAVVASGATQAPSLVHNRTEPGAPIDATVNVVQLRSLDETPLARLLTFAAHPTLITDRACLDGDYPAALRRALDRDTGSIPTLFSPSASGAAAATRLEGETPATAMGEALAKAVRSAQLRTDPKPLLAHLRVELPLPRPRLPAAAFGALREQLEHLEIAATQPVDLILLGKILIAVLPGELSAEVTGALRRRVATTGHQLVLMSHNGAYGGYFLPAHRHGHPGPESCLEIYGPGGGDVIVELLSAVASALP